MSKVSTTSPRDPTQLPSQSVWAKGPPLNGSHLDFLSCSQSPPSYTPFLIAASHSRRPSALGRGIPIREGVNVPRSSIDSISQGGSAVTFGSIENLPAPSSSPAATPLVETNSVKSFGSIPAIPSTRVDGKLPVFVPTAVSWKLPALPAPSVSAMVSPSTCTMSSTTPSPTIPVLGKANITKLFQGSSGLASNPWPPYYYPVDPYVQPPWFYHNVHQQPHPLHISCPVAPTTQGPPHSSIPLLPLNPPPALPPGIPAIARAVPYPPLLHTYQPSGSLGVSSHPTPPTDAAPSTCDPKTNTSTFALTSRTPAIVIRYPNGTEISPEALNNLIPRPPMAPVLSSSLLTTRKSSKSVRSESKKSKKRRARQERIEQEKREAARREEEERKRMEDTWREEEAKRTEETRVEQKRIQTEDGQEKKELADWDVGELWQLEALRCELSRLETGEIQGIVKPPFDASKIFEERKVVEGAEIPLDESAAARNISLPLSSLVTARKIERLQDIEYPEGVRSPRKDLNMDAGDSKFRYDRDFLLQFMHVCQEKPPNLPPLDFLSIGRFDVSKTRGSGRHHKPASISQFSISESGPTNEEHHLLSTETQSTLAAGGPATLQVVCSAMTQTTSQSGADIHSTGGNRVRSKRGDRRKDAKKATLELAAPLQMSANRWIAISTLPNQPVDVGFPALVERKVRALLNKLTMTKFDSISDKIIVWVNTSEKERINWTLLQVIRLVFESAIAGSAWGEMYARMCRKMTEAIDDDTGDESEGNPIVGGQLFRIYLLNRCQEDFERDWVTKEMQIGPAMVKASDDRIELFSDEYYAAQKAKRRRLGLIKFIGELFKFRMLMKHIMLKYINRLLAHGKDPSEDKIEGLCELLKTVGRILDVPETRHHMDMYFTQMKELRESPHVRPRMQFMLQDVIELRDRNWVARHATTVPTTVHETAVKEKVAVATQGYQRQPIISGGRSRLGGDRVADSGPELDYWTVGGDSVARSQPNAGDLPHFGKINKGVSMTIGSSTVSRKKKLKLLPKKHGLTTSEEARPPVTEDRPQPTGQISEAGANKANEDAKEIFATRSWDECSTSLPEEHLSRLVNKLAELALESMG